MNFSRTVSITFHWRGDHLQRAGHVLAELAQAVAAAALRNLIGGSITTRSRGRCSGKVLRSARLRVNPRTVVVLATASSAASSSSVALGLQLFELQRQLIDQPRRAFRPLAVDLALEFGDPQLLLGDQRLSSDALARATASSAAISNAFARSIASAAFRAATSSGKGVAISIHGRSKSQIGCVVTPQNARSRRFFAQPALCGRQVCRGFLQSIPSSI